ncbi:MAG: outer membrane lipoprotein carrier protein LolA [Alistipes sp.]|nr:outer membrane lipoprotein carrier protein LolA [Candidatus Minthomonas equi]
MKGIITLVLSLLFPLTLLSQENDLTDIKTGLAEASRRLSSVSCDFIQTKESPMLSEKMLAYGRMSYKKPDYLKWEYDKPFQYAFVLDGTEVSVTENGKTSATDIGRNKAVREMARIIKGCIEGTILSDSGDFDSSVAIEDGIVYVYLQPVNKELKKMWSKMVLEYSPEDWHARSFELQEISGDITTIVFRNCNYDFSK